MTSYFGGIQRQNYPFYYYHDYYYYHYHYNYYYSLASVVNNNIFNENGNKIS